MSALDGSSLDHLKHFLYLDTYRTKSYLAQLRGGLPVARRILEASSIDAREEPSTREKEERTESRILGKGSLALFEGAYEHSTSKTSRLTSGGLVKTSQNLTALDSLKLSGDDLYLELERELLQKGFLNDDHQALESGFHAQLVLYRGKGLFQNVGLIAKILGNPEQILDFLNVYQEREGSQKVGGSKKHDHLSKKVMKAMATFLESFASSPVFILKTLSDKTVFALLNPSYLLLTPDQLNVLYGRSSSFVLVGYALPSTPESVLQEGFLPLPIDWDAFYRGMFGTFDLRVDPLAIYAEIPLGETGT